MPCWEEGRVLGTVRSLSLGRVTAYGLGTKLEATGSLSLRGDALSRRGWALAQKSPDSCLRVWKLLGPGPERLRAQQVAGSSPWPACPQKGWGLREPQESTRGSPRRKGSGESVDSPSRLVGPLLPGQPHATQGAGKKEGGREKRKDERGTHRRSVLMAQR